MVLWESYAEGLAAHFDPQSSSYNFIQRGEQSGVGAQDSCSPFVRLATHRVLYENYQERVMASGDLGAR